MITSRPTLIARLTLIAVFVVPAVAVSGQIPGGSSARVIQTEVEKSAPRVAQIISKAEDSFRKGKLNLEAGKRSEARDDFDQAVDEILTSGIDVRASQELQTYYLELVERIYREEVPTVSPSRQANVIELVAKNNQGNATPAPPVQQIGFVDQRFEPSPLDELSKLVLTSEEQNVSESDVLALEQAKQNVNFGFTINPLIQQYINCYQGRGRSTMESGLRRSGQYMKMARQIFKEEGVPVDITWLGQVESAWRPKAVSWAAASGLWQFIPATGRDYGLRQTAYIDERNSFEKATRASAKY